MFDEDNSGSMDFAENMTVIGIKIMPVLILIACIQAKFAMMMSTPEEKLSWIFEIFDSDGGNHPFPNEDTKNARKVLLIKGMTEKASFILIKVNCMLFTYHI